MTAACAGARSFSSLFLARMGVGIGEATLSPAAFSLLSDYFPKARLATALSIFSMGIFFGSGLALILGGLIIGAVGSWRLTFLLVGLPGLLAALLALTIREPARRDLLLTTSGQPTRLGLADVARQVKLRWRSVAGICFGFAAQALCNYAQQAWLPTYFVRRARLVAAPGGSDARRDVSRHGPAGRVPRRPSRRSMAAPRHPRSAAAGRRAGDGSAPASSSRWPCRCRVLEAAARPAGPRLPLPRHADRQRLRLAAADPAEPGARPDRRACRSSRSTSSA